MDELHAWVAAVTDPDELFTATSELMWHLLYRAQDASMTWAAHDLLVAVGELDTGPWTHCGGLPLGEIGLPYAVLGTVLDRMLDRLEIVTPGFGARVAIARARYWLDPVHEGGRSLTSPATDASDRDPSSSLASFSASRRAESHLRSFVSTPFSARATSSASTRRQAPGEAATLDAHSVKSGSARTTRSTIWMATSPEREARRAS